MMRKGIQADGIITRELTGNFPMRIDFLPNLNATTNLILLNAVKVSKQDLINI